MPPEGQAYSSGENADGGPGGMAGGKVKVSRVMIRVVCNNQYLVPSNSCRIKLHQHLLVVTMVYTQHLSSAAWGNLPSILAVSNLGVDNLADAVAEITESILPGKC